ncbi:MAG: Stk1 family PASTA domain-containing Ser/Thr kinase [Dermatophilaceae bacterium]
MPDVPELLGGRYEVGDLLGRGGMAEVHLGFDSRLGRQVAIKMLRTDLARDQTFLSRFRREAQAAASLGHSAIVAVFDHGEDHVVESGGAQLRVPYIVMEYVDGRTLRDVLAERGPLAPAEALRITEGVLDALGYSHRGGIVHRDIKPANVMIAADGTVKVMDFGIARAMADANATMTQTQAVIGTAQYLSPEQAQGQPVDARSDLYSTGCMLFELLTGRPPFVGDSPVSVAYQHVQEPPTPPSHLVDGIGSDVDAVILHALAKAREARYQDAGEFRADLQAVRLGRPIGAAARSTAALAGAALGGIGGTRSLSSLPPEAEAPTRAFTASDFLTPVPHGAESTPATRSDLHQQKKSRRRPAAVIALIVAALAALGLLAYGVVMGSGTEEPVKVAVPDVVDSPQQTAEARLRSAGLQVRVVTEASDTVPEADVIRQDPEARAEVSRGVTVTITVSTGPSSVTVPDLKGRTADEARQQLSDLGLQLGEVEEVNDPVTERGVIIDSNPGSGTAVAAGTSVNVRVGTGKVTVPNVVGLSQNDAQRTLADANLQVQTEFRQTVDVPEGQVLEQGPATGEAVDQGTQVKIVVAQKPAPSPSPTPSPSPPSPSPSESLPPSPPPS